MSIVSATKFVLSIFIALVVASTAACGNDDHRQVDVPLEYFSADEIDQVKQFNAHPRTSKRGFNPSLQLKNPRARIIKGVHENNGCLFDYSFESDARYAQQVQIEVARNMETCESMVIEGGAPEDLSTSSVGTKNFDSGQDCTNIPATEIFQFTPGAQLPPIEERVCSCASINSRFTDGEQDEVALIRNLLRNVGITAYGIGISTVTNEFAYFGRRPPAHQEGGCALQGPGRGGCTRTTRPGILWSETDYSNFSGGILGCSTSSAIPLCASFDARISATHTAGGGFPSDLILSLLQAGDVVDCQGEGLSINYLEWGPYQTGFGRNRIQFRQLIRIDGVFEKCAENLFHLVTTNNRCSSS